MEAALARTRLRLLAPLLALALVAAACGSDDDSTTATTAGGGTTDPTEAQLTATLNASGATFPLAFYEEVIAAYKEAQPGVTVNYGGGGSGKGRQELQDQVVDFAGSDGLVKPEDVAKFKGGEFLYVPTVAGPITISYKLAGVDTLKLDADVVAKIFQREITTWNDPAVAALNKGVTLPSTAITVAHRSDSSGTTENFTKYLAAAAPQSWKLGSGSTVTWPADSQGGNGNSGVAQIVTGTEGAIGYVDLSDAKATKLTFAELKNKAGKFVKADVDGATAAVESVTPNPDLSYSPLDADGDGAYPITAPTWILVYKTQTDGTKGQALKSFLTFLLNDGQDLAPDIDYAPLPDALRAKALAQLDNIVVP